MARFPRREGEMIHLADQMIRGLDKFGHHFDGNDLMGLKQLRQLYQDKKERQNELAEAYKAATEDKDGALMDLINKMKDELRQAELSTEENPALLERIGWGTKSQTTVTPPPSAPRELDLKRDVHRLDVVNLAWRPPQRGTGGRVAFYEVERRDEDGEWLIVATAFETETELLEQPRGQMLKYRVIAKNKAGASRPSNEVAIAL